MDKSPKIGLVLGAGSARGYAHIGVLQVLEENNIPFDFIVGSSMGAMIGGIYASGTDLRMLEKTVCQIDTSIFYDIHVPRLGFMAGKRIVEVLRLLTKKKDFSELAIPLSVVATDLLSGQRVVLEEGSVAEAIRASISIPGIFNPVRRDDMVLVDGAVIDRLPVDVAREKGADVVIAVDVTFGPDRQIEIKNALDVILTSLDIMQKLHFDLSSSEADIVLQPKVGRFSSRDFDKADEIIALGREEAKKKLEIIKEKIKMI
ncbi:patatin-like phospholipase family protein [Thermosyntropha sp.]|uniref:patatin-like phospholipase family protein n=1 Tax=Thermosyntropha sp. TaxID=2740820 RepID=UPI0025FC1E5A|nr:patatin-like phospholipase family protein [Thermosyntropha sp.]MBO8159447.1 patatin-like phospholipase family protein [Thermosyntropha sp.]